MNPYIPVQAIYVLTAIFAALSIIFLKGKASALFVGHNTAREPVFSTKNLCKALGVCFAVITILLLVTALIWNNMPRWFFYVFWIVLGADILASEIICNLNIIVKK